MFQLRPYQKEKAAKCLEILKTHRLCILNGEVRTGKTHTALNVASNYKSVLFVTKKKAMQSIKDDYETAGHSFNMDLINFESVHKMKNVYDLVIVDESHKISAYPKPSKQTKTIKQFCKNDVLIMTGTLTPESYSQIFHQLWISNYSPFKHFRNFYQWFKTYGTPETIYTAYGQSTSYKNAHWSKIEPLVKPLIVTITQKEANFKSEITEHFHYVEVKTKKLIAKLLKDRIIEGNHDTIVADTPAKLMQKVHQLASGTIKLDSGNTIVLCKEKAEYIKKNFPGKKAIFYKYIAELESIKSVLDITQDIEEFNNSNKDIALQFVSGREGTNLSKAENLIMYNIDHSAVSYWQSRDRMTVKDREENNIHWIFDRYGIASKIYKVVKDKKKYTTTHFKKDLRL